MPDLLVSNPEGETIAETPLRKQGLVTLGRSEGNDLVIARDSVSRRHTIVFEYEHRWFAADLGSKKGLSNEAGSTRFHEFKTPESWVRMGPTYLWVHGAVPRDAPPRPEPTHDASPGPVHLAHEFQKRPEDLPGRADDPLPLYLVFQQNDGPPQRMIDLTHVDRLLVGRGRTCDLVLDDPAVSRLHCVIYREGRYFCVADAGSSRGLRADGSRWLRKRLIPGTLLQFGNLSARVMIPESAVLSQPDDDRNTDAIFEGIEQDSAFAPPSETGENHPVCPRPH